ncbi:hypothetical protein HPB50_018877 [Hyalomma asiaticum]|uniref:Uncharacterized protein n=1 Tax=Hyalomma asiaticum TaxID=266040 RepID=A0ACB7TRC4_HYAAI|nr:hypothetical protein HPB50_018877 [Hyalomma asiaticum]
MSEEENETSAEAALKEPSMDFDEYSRKTLAPEYPWKQATRKKSQKKTENGTQIKEGDMPGRNIANDHDSAQTQPTGSQQRENNAKERGDPSDCRRAGERGGRLPKRQPGPPLPEDEYKVVFRPQTALNISKWTSKVLTQSIANASGIPTKEFYEHVTIQMQWNQNLIVASTALEERVEKLLSVTQIQLGKATYELLPYVRTVSGFVKGVVHGIEAGTTTQELYELISTDGYTMTWARMLGKTSTTAVLYFEGPHVPFYVKVGSVYTHCRPYRKTVQFCRACHDFGHRSDVCPNPDRNLCDKCGVENPRENHECHPICKLCELPHLTASRECKKRLKPAPPPLRIREARSKSKTRPLVETTSEEKATGNIIQPSSNNNVDENPSPEKPQKKSRSRSRSRGCHQQQQQKVSWAHFINPPSAPSNSSPKTQQQQQQEHQQQQQQQQQQISKLEKTVESLRELNSKLMKRLDDCEKRPQHFTRTSLPMSLEERINTIIEQKLERMVDQKIEQRFQQLEHFLEQRLSQITNAMTEKFGNIGTTILKMGEAIDTLTNTISSLVSRADESDRRLATLEKEREQLRKKPKPNQPCATTTSTLHNGEQ